MTLIAFQVYPDAVEVVTDSMSYDANLVDVTFDETKVEWLPRIDTVMFGQGSLAFGLVWQAHGLRLAGTVATFDDFAAAMEDDLPDLWAETVETARSEFGSHVDSWEGRAFLAGHSHAAGRFRAYGFSSDDGFARDDIDRPFLMPAPYGVRLDPIEARKVEQMFRDVHDADKADDLIGRLRQLPQVEQLPTTDAGWVSLAEYVRETRSMLPRETRLKVMVGGRLLHVRLTVGDCVGRWIHTFNDTGDEFARLVSGTFHPVAQAGPCPCGSEVRALDCHILPQVGAKPCPCGRDATFDACCSIDATEAAHG